MQQSKKAPARAAHHIGRNDTLVSSSMLKHAVQAILRRTKLDHTYDIPYLAGYSNDGRTIYIDRHLPKFCNTRDRRVGVDQFLILHEAVEKALLDKLGLHYQHAHQIALRAEEAAVRADGISWREYDQFMRRYIKDVGHEKLRRIPLDLDIKPYRDEHDTQLLKSIQKTLKREFALRHRQQIGLRN